MVDSSGFCVLDRWPARDQRSDVDHRKGQRPKITDQTDQRRRLDYAPRRIFVPSYRMMSVRTDCDAAPARKINNHYSNPTTVPWPSRATQRDFWLVHTMESTIRRSFHYHRDDANGRTWKAWRKRIDCGIYRSATVIASLNDFNYSPLRIRRPIIDLFHPVSDCIEDLQIYRS